MIKAHILIATPESDAKLRDEYEAKGAAAYNAGHPRTPPCDPASMIGAWWFGGWDAAADQHS